MTADGDTQNQGTSQTHGDTENQGSSQNDRGTHTSGEGRDHVTQPPAAETVPAGVLPNKAAEDDPRRWGDEPGGYDHDSWLEEQKPPHWG